MKTSINRIELAIAAFAAAVIVAIGVMYVVDPTDERKHRQEAHRKAAEQERKAAIEAEKAEARKKRAADDEYLRRMKDGAGSPSDVASGGGKRCGDSYIPASHTCHK